MARLVGKKLARKHSAIGSIVVSHSDLEGVARYSYVGIDNFNIDAESNYDNLVKDTSLTESTYLHALVPWTSTKVYNVPTGAIFMTKSGIPFICAESKEIKTCTKEWDLVNSSAANLLAFKANDGWNNFKYITVPVVQGIQKEIVLGASTALASQTFLVSTLDIEAADSLYTKQFCYIEVESNGEVTKWSEIQHLQLATSTDKVFEIEISDDLSGTVIKFGDSINGAIPPKDAIITLHYLETLGEDGNVTELYNFQNEIDGAEIPTNSEYPNLTIGCQNTWPIVGGKNLESLAEFKANAETAYAKNYEILHTYPELLAAINSISPIPMLKVKTSTYYETTNINSTKVVLSKIGITGLSTAVQPLNTIEASLFETIVNANLNKKVLSNKYVKYLAPEIVEIDSSIQIEPKESVISKDDFKQNLEDYLLTNFGKSKIDPIDCYKQADLIRGTLQHTSNVGSIQSTSLLTVQASDVYFGLLGANSEKFFIFTFEYPTLNLNSTSNEGYSDRSLADGNEVCYVFNVSINNNNNTFVVQETSNSEAEKLLFEQDDYFNESSVIYFYKNLNTENAKYNLKTLKAEKHTFSKDELQSISNLALATTEPYASSTDSKGYYFSVTRSKETPKFYLALNAQTVAEYLGFKASVSDNNIKSIYNNLLGSIENGSSKLTVSFEPADKTVTGPWNTVMYYNNINVDIENTLNA